MSKWERGDCFPDITLLLGLANYFGVSVDELLRELILPDLYEGEEKTTAVVRAIKLALGLLSEKIENMGNVRECHEMTMTKLALGARECTADEIPILAEKLLKFTREPGVTHS